MLKGIRAWVFDAYSPLFDYASPAAACRDALGGKYDRLTSLWRERQLQYTWLRAAQDKHADFCRGSGDALEFALATLGLPDPALAQRILRLNRYLDQVP